MQVDGTHGTNLFAVLQYKARDAVMRWGDKSAMELFLLGARFIMIGLLYLFLYRAIRLMFYDLRLAESSAGAVLRGQAVTPVAFLVLEEDGARHSEGALLPRTFRLSLHSTIGRSPDSDIIVDDPFVSWQHAVIEFRGGRFWIRDLGSRNGTFVNGKRLGPPRPLKPADRVKVGDTVFQFKG